MCRFPPAHQATSATSCWAPPPPASLPTPPHPTSWPRSSVRASTCSGSTQRSPPKACPSSLTSSTSLCRVSRPAVARVTTSDDLGSSRVPRHTHESPFGSGVKQKLQLTHLPCCWFEMPTWMGFACSVLVIQLSYLKLLQGGPDVIMTHQAQPLVRRCVICNTRSQVWSRPCTVPLSYAQIQKSLP